MITLFYRDSTCSLLQLARYVGPDGFVSPSGEVKTSDSIKLINNPFVGDVKTNDYGGFLFSMCYGAERKKYKKIRIDNTEQSLLNEPTPSDIENHKILYDQCSKGKKVILYGVSAGGASTTFNSMAMNQYKNVSLVILESCPHSTRDTLYHRYGRLSETLYWTMPFVMSSMYKNEISPSSNVDRFPAGVPVVFISSRADNVVKLESTEKLAKELAKKKKNNVYLLVLNRSSYGNYVSDNRNDSSDYMMFIHALYKEIGAQHENMYATLGAHMLNKCLVKP